MEEIEHQLWGIEGATSYLAAFESVLPQRLNLNNTLPMTEHIPALVMEMERYLQILHGRHRRGQVSEEQIKNVSLLQKNLIPLYRHIVVEAMKEVLLDCHIGALQNDDAKDQCKQLKDAVRRLNALEKMTGLIVPKPNPPDG